MSSGDPLVRNGFDSPLCRDPALEGQLDSRLRDNCQTSSFAASGVPTGNYGFDVHIDRGSFGMSDLTSVVVQDVLLTPAWTALVWVVHALVLALEWCYSVDLLDGATIGAVAGALRGAQRTFTEPWMVAALSVAAVLVLYRGLVQRRVADTLGDFALMMAMMAVGLWVILDPGATVGTLSQWARQSSLGALAAVSSGTPDRAAESLGSGMNELFATAIGDPWCYLEFGDVRWCRDPARLDPRLRSAADRIAAAGTSPAPSGALLRSARTNGDLFLALAANGPERNSINDSGSLLHVLCGTYDATHCRGPTAEQAQFRTAGGTWPRAGGLLLIAIGAVGMIALLAFIALRLLGAAMASLLYLLAAPVAVLAPALGDGGRRVFRGWGTRLLGAVLAKLLYSVLLGVVLLVLHLLNALGTLGWWTQWTLVAVLWWTAFGHRHEIARLATMGHRETGMRGMRVASSLMIVREMSRLARGARRLTRAPTQHRTPPAPRLPDPPPPPPFPDDRREPPSPPGPAGDPVPPRAPGPAPRPPADASQEVARSGTPGVASGRPGSAPGQRGDPSRQTTRRMKRLAAEEAAARAGGDRRRAARLADRRQRLSADAANSAAATAALRPGNTHAGAWLARQALLPAAREPARGRPRRDYAALAPLAGITSAEYEALDHRQRLGTRLAIDRELDRRGSGVEVQSAGQDRGPQPPPARVPATSAAAARGAPAGGSFRTPAESPVLRRERQFAARRRAQDSRPPGRARPPERSSRPTK